MNGQAFNPKPTLEELVEAKKQCVRERRLWVTRICTIMLPPGMYSFYIAVQIHWMFALFIVITFGGMICAYTYKYVRPTHLLIKKYDDKIVEHII